MHLFYAAFTLVILKYNSPTCISPAITVHVYLNVSFNYVLFVGGTHIVKNINIGEFKDIYL